VGEGVEVEVEVENSESENTPQNVMLNASHSSPLEGRSL